jgi:hypothetical protein
MTVSSATVYGGVPGGRQVIAVRDEWWITTPAGALTRLFAGIVTLMAGDSSSLSPLISAAVS